MTNKIVKIIIKIIIILIIFETLTIPTIKALSWNEIISKGEEFIQEGKNANSSNNSVIDNAKVKKVSSDIYNVLAVLGIVFSVIVGGILGIQIMWGSIEQQAKAKEMLLPYGIGCITTFGAFGIWKLAVTIFSQL